MNDLGQLATDITVYQFECKDINHPKTFVSGWLEANVGQLNGWTNEEFTITGEGNFSPSLEPVEKAIFTCLYEIDYYEREGRKVLREVNADGAGDWTLLREGDSTIQKTSKYRIAQSYSDRKTNCFDKLKWIIARYNSFKASPLQVAGTDYLPYYLDTETTP